MRLVMQRDPKFMTETKGYEQLTMPLFVNMPHIILTRVGVQKLMPTAVPIRPLQTHLSKLKLRANDGRHKDMVCQWYVPEQQETIRIG
jgi:hypothetical protein